MSSWRKSNPDNFRQGLVQKGRSLTNQIEVLNSACSATGSLWSVRRGQSPVIATAIHDGRLMRQDLLPLCALSESERLREEDPFTAVLISGVPNQIVFHRSRFEIDLNRGREQAVYFRPEQAWGLTVWKNGLPASQHLASLMVYDDYYEMLGSLLKAIERNHGEFVLLDVHSYNHRRAGPDIRTDPEQAPDINIGTFSMDRDRWAHVVDPLMEHFRAFKIGDKPLAVGENIAFQGKGEQTRFIHEQFPKTGCAIAIEFKKIFMDEWTGQPDNAVLGKLRDAVTAAVPLLERIVGQPR
ncbi:N-formylglutamate amidohydrolase protein (plasmid) [Rhizobium gallicum bv. gallicum R602sp]|uniref:N-formylglutamate amidohydrolase protein n=1 Tax=Rhizobium gallicum bv. gallicum R602sp TaxID=1041138 RepID=A0A0B4XGU1_9HYPH|nr:N-formylglutamate amidohydrolase protein [Rhizobium gallicum bv. gallicum R602sp]